MQQPSSKCTLFLKQEDHVMITVFITTGLASNSYFIINYFHEDNIYVGELSITSVLLG